MKRALIISGGGAKGAFAVGILQGLKKLHPDLHFDIIVGTSTGALIAPFAALEEYDLLEEIYTSQTTRSVIGIHRLGDRLSKMSIFSVEPLWRLIKTYMTDERYEAIQQSGKSIYITTTCLQTEDIVIYTSNPSPHPVKNYLLKSMKDAEHMRLSVLASACQPVFMTPVKVDENYETGIEKDFQYVDGGVREYAGIQMALDQGAEEIYCILHSSEKGETEYKEYSSLFPILQRTISMMCEDVASNDVFFAKQQAAATNYIQSAIQRMKEDGIPTSKIMDYFHHEDPLHPFHPSRSIKLHILRPDAPLGGGPGGLIFDKEEMREMVEKGRDKAVEWEESLEIAGSDNL